MRFSFFLLVVFSAPLGSAVAIAEADEVGKPKKERVVAAIDFDKKEPAYVYSYSLAGYGDPETNKTMRANDQLTATHPAAGKDSAGAQAKLDAGREDPRLRRMGIGGTL